MLLQRVQGRSAVRDFPEVYEPVRGTRDLREEVIVLSADLQGVTPWSEDPPTTANGSPARGQAVERLDRTISRAAAAELHWGARRFCCRHQADSRSFIVLGLGREASPSRRTCCPRPCAGTIPRELVTGLAGGDTLMMTRASPLLRTARGPRIGPRHRACRCACCSASQTVEGLHQRRVSRLRLLPLRRRASADTRWSADHTACRNVKRLPR